MAASSWSLSKWLTSLSVALHSDAHATITCFPVVPPLSITFWTRKAISSGLVLEKDVSFIKVLLLGYESHLLYGTNSCGGAERGQCLFTRPMMSKRQGTQAIKNSFIILHALDTTADSATELSIYSPDTYVRRYLQMCPKTTFVTGSATTQQNNQIATNCRSAWISQDSRTTSIPCLSRG